ncbi:hypothetical protein [Oceanibium sediminis]|uniref:hypothetical protein n=1 Tax=Oceanibium sediminis TaxID=2026339 RepID=UPI001300501A|nr:hypothetical protein [Oceanibium sediminis]
MGASPFHVRLVASASCCTAPHPTPGAKAQELDDTEGLDLIAALRADLAPRLAAVGET